ncbi:hypothetical protein HN51_018037 [Arachis hypogaea]|uniref:uncharacterized protein n=1 Tax=Arachis hypogaea TaxID=3818 RepID=UPI000DEC8798|nr:uncharacterized protein LOC112705818 [Arachis hypogaea]QHO29609.1 Pheromone receptor-like protein [Arachis hypogaea]
MEVAVASPSPPGSPSMMDHFDFNGARISPYLSAPSSPRRFGEYYNLSAPTSPSRLREFYSDFDYFTSAAPSPSLNGGAAEHDDGFAFFVSGESVKSPRSAEELFHGGKIKPMRVDELLESSRSPLLQHQPKLSPIAQGKKAIREALSPRKKRDSGNGNGNEAFEERRGRDRTPAAVSSSSRRVSRSHSPYRVSHYTWEEELHHHQQLQQVQGNSNKEDLKSAASLSSSSSSSSSKSSKRWRLRDLLLFRSASEGRGTTKDPFRKYPLFFKKPEETAKASSSSSSSSSFRNSEMPPKSRRKEAVSAHELHYARKKAESQDLKKRTFLPYKQGILGRLAGFGSPAR